jgi:hypothetical protein
MKCTCVNTFCIHAADVEFLFNLGDWPQANLTAKGLPVMSWCGRWELIVCVCVCVCVLCLCIVSVSVYCVCGYTHIDSVLFVCMYARMYVYLCVCMRVCVYIWMLQVFFSFLLQQHHCNLQNKWNNAQTGFSSKLVQKPLKTVEMFQLFCNNSMWLGFSFTRITSMFVFGFLYLLLSYVLSPLTRFWKTNPESDQIGTKVTRWEKGIGCMQPLQDSERRRGSSVLSFAVTAPLVMRFLKKTNWR